MASRVIFLLLFFCFGAFTYADDSPYRAKPDPKKGQKIWKENKPSPARNVHPDCTETPVAMDAIIKAANDPKVQNQTQFLNALPENSFQNFTFITESQSPEAACISEKYPGVFRMATDGATVIRYTCDPNCALYNRMQIFHFDDEKRSWQPTELQFNRAAHERANLNPSSCVSCHNPSSGGVVDMRPNWKEYPNWPGLMGRSDDNLNDTLSQALSLGEDQATQFLKFKKRITDGDLKENHCYTDLPWYKGNDPKYRYYPYGGEYKTTDYNLRPNLKFTEVLSHRMGQRLARKMEENPAYPKLKFKILMAALSCDNAPIKELDKALGAGEPKVEFDGDLPVMVAIGKKMGFTNADFTMNYNQPSEYKFVAGIAPDFQLQIPGRDPNILDVIPGQLLTGMMKDTPEIAPFVQLSKGETHHFGPQFSCIDDLGGAVTLNDEGKRGLCDILKLKDLRAESEAPSPAAANQADSVTCAGDASPTISDEPLRLLNNSLAVLDKLDPEAIQPMRAKHGKEIVGKVCASCHGENSTRNLKDELRFFKNEKTMRSHLCDSGLAEEAKKRMDDVYDPMPPFGEFDSLSDAEQRDVSAYLSSVKGQCK